MSDGDTKDVDVIEPDKDGKHPDTVPWDKYVGIKEMMDRRGEKATKAETELKDKVTGLEEKLKTATNPEEFKKVSDELEETKKKLTESDEELKNTKEKTLAEKRGILTKRNIPEEKVKDMSVQELDAALVVLEHTKPGADLGGGGGSDGLKGSPMELAQRAYTK